LLKKQLTPDLGREIETILGEGGAALVVHQKRTFVVVEVEEQPVTFPQGVYDVTDPDEAAEIEDALDDADNPTFAHKEALDYLRQIREKRHGKR